MIGRRWCDQSAVSGTGDPRVGGHVRGQKLGQKEESVCQVCCKRGKRWEILVAGLLWYFARCNVVYTWQSPQSLGPLALHSYNRLLISLCAPPFLVFHSVSGPTRDGCGNLSRQISQCSGNSRWCSSFPALLGGCSPQCCAFCRMLLVCLQCWKTFSMREDA